MGDFPRWADRPGPIGSLQERAFYEQAGARPPDTVAQVKAILRSSLDTPVKFCLMGRAAEDGAPELTTEMINRVEVANAVSRLPHPLHRWGVTLVYERGMKREDAAEKLGVSTRTLDRYLAEALELVADYVCEYIRDKRKNRKS